MPVYGLKIVPTDTLEKLKGKTNLAWLEELQ